MILLACAVSLLLLSCKKDPGDGPASPAYTGTIFVNFHNQTGSGIIAAKADTRDIGGLPAGASSGYVAFERFETDTELPACEFTGIVEGKAVRSTLFFCGAERDLLAPGKYDVDLRLVELGGEKWFEMRFR